VEHGGYENEDWVVHTPVLKSFASDKLTPEQAQATLEYFLLRQVVSLTFLTLTRSYGTVPVPLYHDSFF
jgi:hypothetical protein